MSKKKLHITVEDNIYDTISDLADQKKTSIQEIVNETLSQYISRINEDYEDDDSRFKFIDLFAGIGGMRIAFESVGGRCVFSSEWDKYSQKTYFSNHGDLPDGDITLIDERTVPNHDILVAGFPCQPFSIAGVSKKNSMGRNHGFMDKTQGTLFFDIVRILNEKRPKAFLLENVKNLKSHDKGNTFKIISETLREMNYDISYEVIDGKSFVPQHRERIFIIGFDKDYFGNEINYVFPDLPRSKIVLSNILEKNVDDKYTLSDKLWNYLQNYAAKHKAKGNGFGYGLADLNGTTRTLSARYYKDGSEILIPQKNKNPRRLTPRECARLQGFPEKFKIVVSNTQAYKQFGNSVVVPLIAHLAESIINHIDKMEYIEDERVII
ncbi:DNA (cytosine-5)-methyltransferase 1 [Dethiosulfatibacter aminovorans DSM 17477]|uniref:Cytosine-specific methyltransferase n=1 Tax=Dethiosulfatibacter aminovorans DSM 17477 TaxID=1121476 RepID=A0A1M6I908_9FIRM|nr:DNA (cytosine-5-)-methyltransferase [Dethiosulfatibacter aminovorans]SHJ30856.1 DNA (cytosine-5)-methyltransferase 1 [Dethiosulfatibacter aminovorans DSM 17477]